MIKRRFLPGTVALSAALLSATLLGGAGLVLDRTWHTARGVVNGSIEHTARVVENTVNRQLLQVDIALASLPTLLTSLSNQTGEVTVDSANRLLRGLNFQAYAFRDVLLVQPDGRVWASARPRPRNRPVPLEAVELAAAAQAGAGITVSGPVRNPLTGEWALFLARPVTLQGAGAMLAVAEVPLTTLSALLAEAGEAPGLRIMLERPDGALVASQPHDEMRIGKPQAGTIGQRRTDGLAFDMPAAAASPAVIAAARPTLYGGINVAVSIDAETAMADWERDRNRLLAVVLLAELLVLASAGLLHAAFRRQRRLEEERTQAALRLENAIEAMSDGFVMWDANDRLVTCNQKYLDLYAVSAPAIKRGASFAEIMRRGAELGQYPNIKTDIDTWLAEMVAWRRQAHGTMERLLPDGRWVLVTERRTATGEIVGTRTDITQIKTALAEVETANERARHQNRLFDAALNNMSHGLLMVDAEHQVIVCNRRFAELFGLGPDDVAPGTGIGRLFDTIARRRIWDGGMVEEVRTRQLELAGDKRAGTFKTGDRDGTLSITQRPMEEGGFVAIYEDVTEQQEAEDRIRFLAHHDALTQLPNRILFRTRLEEMLSASRSRRQGLALLYLDLDKFKDVNDTLGHPVGDALLEAVGQRLRACLRESAIVARLGGDEFAVACLSSDAQAEAERLAHRIIDSLSAPYGLDGRQVTVGVSVGIALACVEGALDADTLLKNADMALYEAKASGRGVCRLFEPGIESRLYARLEMERDLREALNCDQFELAYQPVFELADDRVCGFEALIRWNHPTRGFVSPAEFIPLAEETELINEIGAFVLERACRDAVRLPGDVRIAVNLSPVQLRSDGIVDAVASALSRSGLDPRRLELEFTESALLDDNERVAALLMRLRALGARLVLDDFGTGYSSLSYLRRFPFDKIKIDQSFVREMTTRPNCAAIVSAVVGLADELGMASTAEGVETEDQLTLVRQVGCREAQGYLLGRPKPILAAYELLQGGSWANAAPLRAAAGG